MKIVFKSRLHKKINTLISVDIALTSIHKCFHTSVFGWNKRLVISYASISSNQMSTQEILVFSFKIINWSLLWRNHPAQTSLLWMSVYHEKELLYIHSDVIHRSWYNLCWYYGWPVFQEVIDVFIKSVRQSMISEIER